jgi:hypothetical protein
MKHAIALTAALLFAPFVMLHAGQEMTITNPTTYDYPTEAARVPLVGQIFSPLTWEQAREGVPEIRLISKKSEEIKFTGPKKDLVDLKIWQESPSRIIYHDGKYHAWFMSLDNRNNPKGMGYDAKNIYVTSPDGYHWEVQGEIPNGEPGSFDDVWREGLQVVKYDNKFWMFYAGNTGNKSKTLYGGKVNIYGIGLLVSDTPAGPWKPAVEGPLFTRSSDLKAWDHDMVDNPYPVYFKGKWYVYYKSANRLLSGGSTRTRQGVAMAEKITGPYTKCEGNPICDGHGSFAWVYRGGITMMPFGYDLSEGRIHWSPDGIHFHNVDDPLSRGIKTPVFSSLYLPQDPLSGDPVTDGEPDQFWGLETRQTDHTNPVDWKLMHGTITFNPVRKEIFTKELLKKIEEMDKEMRPSYWREVYDPGKIPKPLASPNP